MSEMTCPLCGREMTAIETHPGRGELYCGHCDLTIGGNEAKTPDELVALLGQRTCHIVKTWTDSDYADHWRYSCSECGYQIEVGERDVATGNPISHANFCWNCGRKVIESKEEAE